MSKKIAFIGAGSIIFTRNLVNDLLTYPAFADATIALMDIDAERLAYIKRAVDRIVTEGRYPASVVATMDRREALMGADGVVTTILHGDIDVWQHDILIPKKYGVDTNVGDTRGPSGIFRFLRTINPILDIAKDIARYCPGAVFLNYTNPMAMLCRTVQGAFPDIICSGLCHSVQATARMLARWIGARDEDITYTCMGINHQAFYTRFLWKGEDAYPLIRKAITENEAVYNEEQVRNEMFLALGYYVTESSGHNSEYNACTHGTGWNPGEYAYSIKYRRERATTWKSDLEKWLKEPLDLKRGLEYAASIFNAIFGDGEMFKFNGNVRNFNLIDNLPYGCCVEVPVLASRRGLEPNASGKMPPQLALLSGTSAQIEELAVEGFLAGDKEMIYQAICFDPLTAAVCSLREIRAMVNEMFEQNKDWMPQFKGGKL